MQSALKELDKTVVGCRIPTLERIVGDTKQEPLLWDALELYNEPSTVQCDTSFQEQKLAIKSCLEAIDKYVKTDILLHTITETDTKLNCICLLTLHLYRLCVIYTKL